MNYPDASAIRRAAIAPNKGHKGTDIAIRYHAAMRHGMDVLAAAGGSVLRVHDGMMDHGMRLGDPVLPSAPGQYCGKIGPAR
jgi:hypothetical protein